MSRQPQTNQQPIRIADLLASGLSYPQARSAVAHMERLARGAYGTTEGLSAESAHLLAARAMLSRVTAAVMSHTTAAVSWGLPVRTVDLDRVHVSPVSGRRGNPKRGPGYHFHNTPVPPQDVDDGRTCPVRTVLDCARLITMDWAVVIADSALHSGLVDLPDLTERAHRVRHVTGAARARALPALCSPLAESPGESLLRLRLQRIGLSVEEQVSLAGIAGRPRVDFLVEAVLVIEFDGRFKYGIEGDPEQAHWEEKLRHDRVTEAGYEVLRLTWADLWDEAALRPRVFRALARARARRDSPTATDPLR